jgi:uncharacterized protein (DUF1330 family)
MAYTQHKRSPPSCRCPAGGRFLALSNKALALSGAPPKPLIAIVEWHSLDEARAFFSDNYVNLIPSREAVIKLPRFRC